MEFSVPVILAFGIIGSSQRICDACARLRDTEVVLGTQPTFDGTSPRGASPPQMTGAVFVVVVRRASGLALARNFPWGGSGANMALSCRLTVDEALLGSTTTRVWSPREGQPVDWDEALRFRLRSGPRSLRCAEFVVVELVDQLRSGLGAIGGTVGYYQNVPYCT